MNRPRKRGAAVAFTLVLLVLIVYGEGLLPGRTMIPLDTIQAYIPPWNQDPEVSNLVVNNPILTDQVLQFEPWAEFMRQEIAAGRIPLWNPYVAGGVPFVANPQTAVFYPLSTPAALALPDQSPGLRAAMHAFLAAWFTVLFLLRLGVSRAAALFGGSAFAFSQFMTVWIGYPIGCAVAWFPAWLWVAERAATERRGLPVIWIGAAVIGVSALAGHPETTLHCALLSLLWAGVRGATCRPGWIGAVRAPFRVGLAGVGGALLAAVMLVPFLEYLGHSTAFATRSASEHVLFAIPPDFLLGFLYPTLFGASGDGLVPVNYNERAAYVGAITLVLAIGVLMKRDAWRGPWPLVGFMGVIGLVVGFDVFGLHRVLAHVPGLGVSANHRLVFVVQFAIAAYAALALTRVGRGVKLGAWIVVGCLFYAVSSFLLLNPPGSLVSFMRDVPAPVVRHAVLVGLGIVLAAGVAAAVLHRRPAWRVAALISIGIADVIGFAFGLNTVVPAEWRNRSTPEIRHIQAAQPGRFVAADNAFAPASALPFRLRSLDSYEALGVFGFDRLARGLARVERGCSRLDDPRFRLLGVTHLYAIAPLADAPTDWPHSDCGRGRLYRIPRALPRAFLAGRLRMYANWDQVARHIASHDIDPEDPVAVADLGTNFRFKGRSLSAEDRVDIVTDDPDRVVVRANLAGPGMLVLSDAYFPGWEVTDNGTPWYAIPVFGGLRGVALGAGRHQIEFSYRPRSFLYGALITLLAGVIWLGIGVVVLRSRRRRNGRAAATG